MWAAIQKQPLIILLTGVTCAAMLLIAVHGLATGQHQIARSFFYACLLGALVSVLVALAIQNYSRTQQEMTNLATLFAAFAGLPLFMAVPFYDALQTTSFLNAYVEMVSSFTTTGASVFDPARLPDSLHLWRALVAWIGGALIWIAAAAIMAPLNLGGFEITATAAPGRSTWLQGRHDQVDPQRRILRVAHVLVPIYVGLTCALGLMLTISGDRALVAVTHAMSVLSTSGISSLKPGVETGSGLAGEALMALFMLFALSRLTFSADTVVTAERKLHEDPEFRLGLFLVLAVPLVLFLRHWVASYQTEGNQDVLLALRALWGGLFTTLSFLSTTGFESSDWETAQTWSGLSTPGLIFLGLAIMGGGIATTAGGVKLLRVWALYLNGLREMEKLVHPSSVGRAVGLSRRIRKEGAYMAWIFFMMFALSLTFFALVFAGLGASFEEALVLAIAGLSTTGPLIHIAPQDPFALADLAAGAKLAFCAAMVLGRLELLAIIVLLTSDSWRG